MKCRHRFYLYLTFCANKNKKKTPLIIKHINKNTTNKTTHTVQEAQSLDDNHNHNHNHGCKLFRKFEGFFISLTNAPFIFFPSNHDVFFLFIFYHFHCFQTFFILKSFNLYFLYAELLCLSIFSHCILNFN